jgi:hypothetical protein
MSILDPKYVKVIYRKVVADFIRYQLYFWVIL